MYRVSGRIIIVQKGAWNRLTGGGSPHLILLADLVEWLKQNNAPVFQSKTSARSASGGTDSSLRSKTGNKKSPSMSAGSGGFVVSSGALAGEAMGETMDWATVLIDSPVLRRAKIKLASLSLPERKPWITCRSVASCELDALSSALILSTQFRPSGPS